MIEFPPVEAGESIKISATTYVAYLRCPDSAMARLQGVYGPESKEAFRGNLAHRLFARHLQEGPIEADAFEQVCREEIGGSSSLNMKLGALGLRPSGLGRVIEELGGLYDRFRRLPMTGFAGAEVALEVEPADGVVLVGSIDAVFDGPDGLPRLVDWKTGGLGEPLDQLHFYSLLWVLDGRDLPSVVEAVSVRTGERFEDLPSRRQIDETATRVASLVTKVRRAWAAGSGLPRHGGPWCRYCPLLSDCSEGSAATRLAGGPVGVDITG